MKWIFAFTLFLYPIATLGEDNCDLPPFDTCVRPMEKLFDELRTPEDVRNMCPKFISYIACLGNFDETCGDKAPRKIFPTEGEFESVRDMIADVCDENSILHSVLMENIQCLRDGLYNDDNNTCYADRDDYFQSLSDARSKDDSEDYDEYSLSLADICLSGLYSSTCYIEFVAKNCGALTKEAAIEVFHRGYFLRKFCKPEAALEFAEVIDKMEFRALFKDVLKELLQKILKKEK